MEAAENHQRVIQEQQAEARRLVTAGLAQIKEGKTKDFYTVSDRLEKKYRSGTVPC